MMLTSAYLANAWKVLALFLIPVGGGIPAGVVLGQNLGLPWHDMAVLYFISDIILACVFEPLVYVFIYLGRKSPKLHQFNKAFAQSIKQTTTKYGISPSPWTLILISFGVDPMTGRAATHFVGHGFLLGWAHAIAGDMIFFFVIMSSTLWLKGVLGDGTLAAAIIMVIMFLFPIIKSKVQQRLGKTP